MSGRRAEPRAQKSVRPLFRPEIDHLEDRTVPGAGGGFTGAGLTGQYFNNTTLSGTPAFTRTDIRLDWASTSAAPGGSIADGYQNVAATHWSAHWTGQLLARYSETYTFDAFAADAVVLKLRPTGSSSWTTVITQPALTGTDSLGTMALAAGVTYDVDVTFTELTGPWALQLSWSSPSTPKETIDTLTQSGINNPDGTEAYTNIVSGGRNTWNGFNGNVPTLDANGWPSGDANYVFQASLNQGLGVDPLMLGTVTFQFNGKATVIIQGNVDTGSLHYTYNLTTNLTTGTFTTRDNGSNASSISFIHSTRNGQVGGPGGITNLELYLPAAPNSTTSYASNTLFTTAIRNAMSQFEVLRFQLVASEQVNWSDRTPPTYFNQNGGTTSTSPYGTGYVSNNGWSWEDEIMLANETGRDLMISVPTLATGSSPADTQSYIYKLAELIRYGSDGVNPYTSPQADPLYPPLNGNLHVYLELGNELWNTASPFVNDYYNLKQLTIAVADSNNADFQAINYDHLSTAKDAGGNYVSVTTWQTRMAVLRMVQISDIFRSVFGDGAMPATGSDPIVRPLYEWQYANNNNTASTALNWADHYFNKTDPNSPYTGTARPVDYYLWGGGGADYYSSDNPDGLTALLPNNTFGATTVAAGYTQHPAGAGWSFTGIAGIARSSGTGDIPPAYSGSQVGYVTDRGSATATLTFPATQTSSVYAVSFAAVNRHQTGAAAPDGENVRVYLDYGTPNQVDITATTYSQSDGYTPPDYASIGWQARNVSWVSSEFYATDTFSVAPGSKHTITFVGMGNISDPAQTNQTVFLGDVQVTSVDAIYSGGIPAGGDATGQPVGQGVSTTITTEANWAAAFGLKEVSYEGGWSLGGDDGGSPLQLAAKYADSRTATAQEQLMSVFARAGSAVNVFGTYAQWPDWSDPTAQQGLLNISAYPIVQGIEAAADQLPPAPTNGTPVPATLAAAGATLTSGYANGTLSAGGWMSWNVLVPAAGVYNISTDAGGGGTEAFYVDGQLVGTQASAASQTAAPFAVTLSPGLHTVRVVSTSGAFGIGNLYVWSGPPPASGPDLATFSFLGATGKETSDAAGSAASHVTVGALTRGSGLNPETQGLGANSFASAAVGNAYGATLAAAVSLQQYYQFNLSVASGYSMSLTGLNVEGWTQSASPPGIGIQVSTDGVNFTTVYNSTTSYAAASLGQVTAVQNVTGTVTVRIYLYGIGTYASSGIGRWTGNGLTVAGSVQSAARQPVAGFNFAGDTGKETSDPATTVATGLSASAITRGTGLNPETQALGANSIASGAVGHVYGATLAAAVNLQQYYQFAVQPTSGDTLSLSGINVAAWGQNEPPGVGIQVSTDGVNFTTVFTGTTNTASANLSQVAAVQGVSGAVTVRVYLYGIGAYESSGIGRAPGNSVTVTGSVQSATRQPVAGFNFAGDTGKETSDPATTVATGLSASAITRGTGLNPETQALGANSIASGAVGHVYGATLAAAVNLQQYYQFTVQPTSGDTLSLSGINVTAWGQNEPPGVGIQVSTDGVNFATVFSGNTNTAAAALSGNPALQGLSGAVTIRIYLYGVGPYESSGIGRVAGDALDLLGSVS
ncbi:PA14 domain-containing protein [Frigoriglobus tundricola]|uniref:PA14 domain-containing protein n=1 Tax=Frigoriglobus tundricola TaxID=2774151 RepID=A0A6M5Z5L4_9BACT|nr:PA14 domain-containing protein [Frigoriglobus tundricola]QJX00553.1 hypothetical protein FTUN_8183 [Frigoriglobus tundricola]